MTKLKTKMLKCKENGKNLNKSSSGRKKKKGWKEEGEREANEEEVEQVQHGQGRGSERTARGTKPLR